VVSLVRTTAGGTAGEPLLRGAQPVREAAGHLAVRRSQDRRRPVLRSRPVGGEGPREACGLFGVWAPGEDVARLTFFGLFSLQHRGQESAGMAVSDGEQILVYREL